MQIHIKITAKNFISCFYSLLTLYNIEVIKKSTEVSKKLKNESFIKNLLNSLTESEIMNGIDDRFFIDFDYYTHSWGIFDEYKNDWCCTGYKTEDEAEDDFLNAIEKVISGIEPRVESIFVKSTLNLLNEREKRQLYRMLKEERYADELPDDDFYGYGYDEGYAEDDQYIMRKTKQRLISGSLYTGEMYCGVCKTVQSTHNKICDVCGSDDVFNYW
jgi:hypothetical protein